MVIEFRKERTDMSQTHLLDFTFFFVFSYFIWSASHILAEHLDIPKNTRHQQGAVVRFSFSSSLFPVHFILFSYAAHTPPPLSLIQK